MNLFGELLRPLTFVREYSLLGWGDIHSIFIIPLFSISLCTLLVIAYRRGKLDPHRPIAFLIIIYAITTAITPFVQPRYNYFAYVLLALELARKEIRMRRMEAQRASGECFGYCRFKSRLEFLNF